MDFIKVLFRTNNRTGCRFLIVDALNRPDTLHYYEKNGFRYLIADERLEAKYIGIGVGRLPLNTRLMYFDLLKLKVNSNLLKNLQNLHNYLQGCMTLFHAPFFVPTFALSIETPPQPSRGREFD